jgi:hypothetical protein
MSHPLLSVYLSVYLSLHYTTDPVVSRSFSLLSHFWGQDTIPKLAVMDGVLFSFGARICCTDYTFLDLVWDGKDDLWIRWVWFIGFLPCFSVSLFYLEDSPSLFINLAIRQDISHSFKRDFASYHESTISTAAI